MTLHKLSVGDGYTYLTRHVVGGDRDRLPGQDATDYYTALGNPPGRWGGRGLAPLGLAGQVSEEQMRHLFGQGMHPDADANIARHLATRVRPGMDDEEIERLTQEAIRQATLGRRFPVYATLQDFDTRVEQRLDVVRAETGREPTQAETGKVRAEEARRARGAVAGYDLVFTPVKSLVLLWALDEREWVRDTVKAIHEQARDSALQLLEKHAAFTRSGDTGQAQLDTRGLVYAMFDHYDSRDGDPNLHTHVAISNKIQGADGKWRSLDGGPLHRVAVAASEHYNSTIETLAVQHLGVEFAVRPDTVGKRRPVREVAGVPRDVIGTFSSRRSQIEARYEQLVVDFRRAHGRDPDNQAAFRLAGQANLDTRGPKPAPRSLAALREEWTARLHAEHGQSAARSLAQVVTATGPTHRYEMVSTTLSTDQVEALAALAVRRAEGSRSTWTVWNLRAEADRLLREPPTTVAPRGLRFTDQHDRAEVLQQVVHQAMTALCVPVTAEPDLVEPAGLRRKDGTSVFVQHGAARYTSQTILDAEQRLLDAARTPTVLGYAAPAVQAVLDGYEATTGTTLDPGQRAMVVAFATDARLIAVGLGPAGAGKTTTMRAYQHVVAAHGQRLIPLATSAAASAVLSADLGVPAENLHKFVHEHTTHRHADSTFPAEKDFFRVRPGDVILVDEAGLAGTHNLDALRDIASRHGALVRLLGDHRQLAAVESGGALRLLATEAGAVELTALHRFTTPTEADATRRLRDGDTTALDHYESNGRIRGGSYEAMVEQAYTAWHTDMTAGLTTLMSSSTSAGVTALSARARADRVTAGQVEPDGVNLHDGNRAGRGDWIVTRLNSRTMTSNRGKDWVRNGDAWTVTHRRPDGALTVKHQQHGGTLTLPAAYVGAHVELLYATTVHRAQGATVDTTHALITDDMAREHLYVAATRARQHTTLYAVTHRILPLDEDARLDRAGYDPHARAAREVLETVLATEGAQTSATEAITHAADQARSLATLVPRLRYATELADSQRLHALVSDALGPDAVAVHRDAAWPTVVRALRTAESNGWDLPQVLANTARRGTLAGAESPAQLLTWRIKDHLDGRSPSPALTQPSVDDTARYATLLGPILRTAEPFDPIDATRPPRLLASEPTSHDGDHRQLIATVLGDRKADQATGEPAWPALTAAIRRAEHAGHDALTAVATAALARPLHDARSLSEVLAWRLNRHLDTTPPPVEVGTTDGWRTLAWTLKAAEAHGHPAEQLLTAARPGSDLDSIRHQLHNLTRPAPEAGPVPWLDATSRTTDNALTAYLEDATRLIQNRVNEVTDRALTEQPAWLTGLQSDATQPNEHPTWRTHVATIAAYRDQYQITSDDPDQPIGPYVPQHHAGHRAYLHAADAVLAARHPHTTPADPTTARIARDIYLALPDEQRAHIAARIADDLGKDCLGPRDGDPDSILATPTYATRLNAQLIAEGYRSSATTPYPATSATSPEQRVGLQHTAPEPPLDQVQSQPDVQMSW
ncbi:relaxase domain-containing protein [Micromonospora sp. NBC_00330]|uniref:MobF family relaxase n=1 Tax=Micromonospora sp. NBC_00330 TaxID=2903585 RepID=UPI002E2C47F9|nr:MobF family relaxase [Micromonospora sp. NBC_00330]